jgi:hypothetical protein
MCCWQLVISNTSKRLAWYAAASRPHMYEIDFMITVIIGFWCAQHNMACIEHFVIYNDASSELRLTMVDCFNSHNIQ